MPTIYPTADDIREALISVGTPLLDRREIFLTASAQAKLDEMGGLSYELRNGTKVDVLEKARTLDTAADGSVPNVSLIDPTSFVLCTSKEAATILGRLVIVVG